MTDELRRLLDGPDTQVTSVLRSGLDDEPSAERVAQAARALGLGSVALVALTQSAKATGGVTQLGLGSTLAPSSAGLLGPISKGLAIALLVGGAAGSLVLWLRAERTGIPSSHSAPAPSAQAVVIPAAAAVASASTDSLADGGFKLMPAEPVDPASSPVPSVADSRSASAPPAESIRSLTPDRTPRADAARRDDLADELAVLSKARSALLAGDPESALAILAQRAHFTTLDAEARLLRVQALVKAGHSSQALAIAKSTLESGSHDAYACRLMKIAGLVSEACSPQTKSPNVDERSP